MTVRVLWLSKELGIGGAERLLLELKGPMSREIEFVPVAVSAQPTSIEPLYRREGLFPATLGARSSMDPMWLPRFRRMLLRVRPHLVHLHNPLPAAGARVMSAGTGVPLVYTEHSLWSRYHPASRYANALTMWRNNAVVAVSNEVERSILNSPLGTRSRGRLTVIPNGIDINRVVSDAGGKPLLVSGAPVYGTVGHLRLTKGVDVLLRASLLVAQQVPEARGYVVGPGEDEGILRQLSSSLGAHTIQFLGLREDARALMKRFDVFVIASRVEGLPMALLEAMALGRPIVASAVGGIPEVLSHEHDALLVPPEDPRALAEGIIRLLRDRDLACRLGMMAQATVSQYSADAAARRYAGVYGSVLGTGDIDLNPSTTQSGATEAGPYGSR